MFEKQEEIYELESYELPKSDGARTSKHAPDGNLICYLYEDSKTLIEALERGCRTSGNGRCLGWRKSNSEYSWMNYKEFMEKSQNFSSGIVNLGISPGQSTTLGIYGKNSVEVMVAEYGAFYQSMLIVPIYDTLGPDSCIYMINHSGTRVIICDTESKALSLLQRKDEIPYLEHIIVMEKITKPTKILSKANNVGLHLFKDIEELGKRKPAFPLLPKCDDVALLLYTSGTTGDPKGAMLTHRNMIAAITGLLIQMDKIKFTTDDIMISYLPTAHIMEQMCEVTVFLNGASMGFFSGDISQLTEDMKVLKPTFFPAVPRLLNKLYDKAMTFHATKEKIHLQKPLQINEDDEANFNIQNSEEESEFDPENFKSFYESLGGKLRLIFTGAAPITERVQRFYNKALNCTVNEIYGQTECAGPCSGNIVTVDSVGNVGAPFACLLIKLEEVPDLGYYKENKSGEVCLKGYSVFEGYFKDPEKTAEALDEAGWLHTGDIGRWLPNGTLKIVDRKKHIFKLSQGEYVAPEKIENIYLQSPYITQIFVYGDSFQSYLVAIVVPDKDVVMSWCKKNAEGRSWEDICKDLSVKKLIFNDMRRIGKAENLISFEQVKAIHLHPVPFTFEAGQLTPTMKIKRAICRKQFMPQIQEMYGIRNS